KPIKAAPMPAAYRASPRLFISPNFAFILCSIIFILFFLRTGVANIGLILPKIYLQGGRGRIGAVQDCGILPRAGSPLRSRPGASGGYTPAFAVLSLLKLSHCFIHCFLHP